MIPFNIQCILIGLCGTVLSNLAVLYNLTKKARSANLQFKISTYFENDWFAPAISLVALVTALILLPYVPATWPPVVILILFATIGYSGNDLVSRFFSVANSYLNKAIDYKTDIADSATGTLGSPTPTMPPIKSSSPSKN